MKQDSECTGSPKISRLKAVSYKNMQPPQSELAHSRRKLMTGSALDVSRFIPRKPNYRRDENAFTFNSVEHDCERYRAGRKAQV